MQPAFPTCINYPVIDATDVVMNASGQQLLLPLLLLCSTFRDGDGSSQRVHRGHDSSWIDDENPIFNITVFDQPFGEGEQQVLELNALKCNNIPVAWANQVSSVYPPIWRCIRFWSDQNCQGFTRCYCENELLTLNSSFSMSSNDSWRHNIRSIETCGLENGKNSAGGVLFSGYNFTGEQLGVLLDPGECLTFFPGDGWRGKAMSGAVIGGVVNLYEEEHCQGPPILINDPLNFPGKIILSLGNKMS